MKKQILILILVLFGFSLKAYGAATVPLSVNVNGSLVISDASNDTMAGKDPTINVAIAVTPDLGAATATGQANFRIRTNNATWRLTTQRTASNAGGTGIADGDVSVTVTKSAGTNANINAGALVAPFTAATNLTNIPTAAPTNVISGTSKTSTARDTTNTNNWFQVNTTYGIAPDFFYTPGTFSTTITYNLVSP